MTSSWKEIIWKKCNCIFERLNVFKLVVLKKMLFLQMNYKSFWVRKMAHRVSSEAINA